MNENPSVNIPPAGEIRRFRHKLISWFDRNGRDFPWRHTRNAFRVLMAEIMLRRTKAEQVTGVYNNLFRKYSGVRSIAGAWQRDLKKILLPLGLNWRLPTFRLVARAIRDRFACRVPRERGKLFTLPGVGDYVAGAVLSIACGKEEWIVDSNVVRLFRRYFGVLTSKEGRRDRHIIQMAQIYVRGTDPRKANLALLDFSALVCTPREPNHSICPLKRTCSYISRVRERGAEESARRGNKK